MPLVAVCPEHGAFPSRGYGAYGSVNVTVEGNNEACPKCGRIARVVDGTFNFDANGLIEVIAAPGWSIDALRSVKGALIDAKVHASATKTDDDYRAAVLERLNSLIAGQSNTDHQIAALSAKVDEALAGKPRKKMRTFLVNFILALGVIVDAADAGELARDVIEEIMLRFFPG